MPKRALIFSGWNFTLDSSAFIRINVDHTAYYLSGSQLFDQLAGAVYGLLGGVGIQSFFILSGGVGP